ncbi:RING-H2 finger protein ATL46-like [Salvia splendens]|uniref:RING-H2 finger protein ATL46-like n=1 Tax=Salvia splendens TaxID=180675 RepID=UPI001C27DF3C|nr:RING-H2 finger protein ATL46-like [Salvia splendens]
MSNAAFIAAATATYGEDSESPINDSGVRSFLYVVGAIAFIIVVAVIYHDYKNYKRILSSAALHRPYSAGDHAAGAYVQVVVKREDGDGLDAAAINAIPVYTYGGSGAGAAGGCAVCLGEYKESEEVRMMPECGHMFHRRCIDPWLMIHPTCPICRRTPPAVAAAQPSESTFNIARRRSKVDSSAK